MKNSYSNHSFLRNYVTNVLLVSAVFFSFVGKGWGQVTENYTSAGTYTWFCPTGVTSVTVQAWGGGGAGGGVNTTGVHRAGGGGGGGAFSTSIISVVPGTSYTIVVGAGGTGVSAANGNNGASSSFATNVVIAAGGFGGSGHTSASSTVMNGGLGALASSCTPSSGAFSGGNGGVSATAPTSGGGGGGAGSTGNGNTASGATAGTGGTGGGGGGATGISSGNSAGNGGTSPGGGGSGARAQSGSANARAGGAGGAGQIKITYTQPNATLPYFENFSNGIWLTINGSSTNKWVLGSASGNTGNSMYISNDNGTSNAYTNSITTIVHTYRDITIPSNSTLASFTFDWMANGESGFDFLRVWLAPTTYTPVEGTAITAGSGRIQIGTDFNLQSSWQTYSNQVLDISSFANSTMRLIFEWKNDSSGGATPPAAIDNISLSLTPNCTTSNAGTITAGSTSFCTSGTTNLSSTGFSVGAGTTYQWESSNDFAFTSPVNLGTLQSIYTNISTGTISTTKYFRLKVVCSADPSNPAYSNVISVIINTPSVVIPSAAVSICAGVNTTLTVAGASTYTWSPSTGLSSSSGSSVTANPSVTTTYTISGVDANGCITSPVTTVVTVNPVPTAISLTPSATTSICNGNIQAIVATGGSIPNQTILTENFNNGVGSFTVSSTSSSTSQNWASQSNGYIYSSNSFTGSSGSFMMANSDVGGSSASTNTQLISPSFSTVGNNTMSLTFKEYLNNPTDTKAAIEISADNFVTFSTLRNDKTNDIGSLSAFNQTSIAIPQAFENLTSVKIRFNYIGSYDWYWAIDEVLIVGNGPSSINWSPLTELYTNASAITSYSGTSLSTVYSQPTANRTYTATATSNGCSSTSSVTINVISSYTWTGTTSTDPTVASNWNPASVPCSGANEIIPTGLTNYPSYTSLTIAAGTTVTVQSGARLTVTGTLTNNGTLTIESGATLVQGASSTLAGTGTYNVKQAVTGGNDGTNPNNRFWYLGSPVSSSSSSVLFLGANDVVKKRDEPNNTWTALSSGTPENLEVGRGYYMRTTQSSPTINFTGGLINNNPTASALTLNLTRTANSFAGFNLVCNPYPSYLDWDLVTKDQVENTMWYRTADNTNTMVFETYVANSGGIGTNVSGNTATKLIPPMQSFWVRVASTYTSGSITLNNSMRSHFASFGSSTAGLRSTVNDFDLFLRMNLLQEDKKDQIIVYVNENSSNQYDAFDGEKMMQVDRPQFYTTTSGKKIVINGLSTEDTQQSLPITMELTTTGTHQFMVEDLEIAAGNVWLEDKLKETYQLLEPGFGYKFFAYAGLTDDRFVLHLRLKDANSPSTPNFDSANEMAANHANVYTEGAGVVVIKLPTTDDVATDVKIYDASGRVFYTGTLKSLETKVQLEQAKGIYYVALSSSNGMEVRKVFIQ